MKKTTIDIILPAYNEEEAVEKSVNQLRDFCLKNMNRYEWKIIVADNNSKDRTLEIAKELSQKYKGVTYDHLDKKGRGRSLMKVWSNSNSDICCYMDMDLSTDISHLPDLISAIVDDGYDIAIGSRNLKKSQVIGRTFKRTVISKSYILILKILTGVNISDAQCGFKALNRKVVNTIFPLMNPDNWRGSAWFMDTEMLVIAKKAGYRVCEIPVKWVDDAGSTVHIVQDALEDLRGIWRLQTTRPWRKIKKERRK